MRIGEITEFGEISFIDYEKCFVQFCEPGSKGVYGVFSMTFEEIDNHQINRTQKDAPVNRVLSVKELQNDKSKC